ncbi:hypothetical protein SR39_02565, partial [Methylobacterium radiotolerans]
VIVLGATGLLVALRPDVLGSLAATPGGGASGAAVTVPDGMAGTVSRDAWGDGPRVRGPSRRLEAQAPRLALRQRTANVDRLGRSIGPLRIRLQSAEALRP